MDFSVDESNVASLKLTISSFIVEVKYISRLKVNGIILIIC